MNIFCIPFISKQVLFTLRVSLLLSLLNYASVDTGDDVDSFQFSPEAEFTSHLYVYVTFATDTEAELPYCSVKNMLKVLAFRWLLNEAFKLLIRGHVNLVFCLN